MVILVVDFAASSGGALSILKEYYEKALKDKSNYYYFIISNDYIEEKNNVKTIILKEKKGWLKRLLFDYHNGKKIVKHISPDKIISLQNTIIHGTHTPQTVYVHQSIPFQKIKCFSLFKKNETKLAIIQYFMGHLIKKSIKKAEEVIVQTEWMKKAIIEQCKVNESKITIQKPTLGHEKWHKYKNKHRNQFFYPTTNQVYKNIEIILEASELLNKEGIYDYEIEITIEGDSSKNIKYIGKIPHKEVLEKYEKSILLFPSYIETVGLPLLEAKNSEDYIISSDTEFSREVLRGYNNVTFFNPFNAVDLKNKLKQYILNNKE